MKKKQIVVDITSLLLILLFVYAAASKWLVFNLFSIQVSQSPILTDFSGAIVWAIPGLELLIAAVLILPGLRLLGLHLSLALMLLFSGYIVLITHFSPFTPCTCGGVLQSMTWNQHLVFNLFFSFLTAAAIVLYPKKTTATHLLQ